MNYQLCDPAALPSAKKPLVRVGYENVGHTLPLSNSSDAIEIAKSCKQFTELLVTCSLCTLVRGVLNGRCLWDGCFRTVESEGA